MRRVTISIAPDPTQFPNNPLGFSRAVQTWMNQAKQQLEQASAVNDTPCDTPFVVGSFTSTTSVSGTMTGTDIANALCSLISALTKKGIISPTKVLT